MRLAGDDARFGRDSDEVDSPAVRWLILDDAAFALLRIGG
jgi:hypothetical protein